MPIMSTRSTYGYSKVTIHCTGSPSMRKVCTVMIFLEILLAVEKLPRTKMRTFCGYFGRLWGFDDVNQINGPISTVLDIAGCSI